MDLMTLKAIVEIDTSKFETGIAKVKTAFQSAKQEGDKFGGVSDKFKSAGQSMQDLGGKITNAGKSMAPVSAAFSGIGIAGVKSFADVDKTMALTNQTMGNTEKEASMLNQAMKDAASQSVFGMKDAAEATLNFARAGLDAEQAASTLAPAMNLAAGESGNLDTVSAGLVATINGFHDSFDNAGQYADVFAAACNNSALDVDSLSNAMSVAAPIFSSAGYSVNDAALYMGVMANNGIDANVAANSLKTGLARLVSPAKEGAAMMDKLDFSITNTDGTMKSSVQIQKELHDKFQDLSESEQIAAASAIFGKNQMAPWLALINTAPEDVGSLNTALDECAGTTEEMAKAMQSGFGGSLEKLKSGIDVAVTSIGEALAPTITKVANAIQSAVDWFNSLDASQQQAIATIGLVVAAVAPVLMIIGKVISVGGTLVSGIGTVVGLAGGLVSTIAGIAAAFAAIAPAILGAVAAAAPFLVAAAAIAAVGIVIYKNWNDIKAKSKEIWSNITNTVKQKWSSLKSAASEKFGAIKTAISEKWNAIKSDASSKWESIKSAVTQKVDAIKTGVSQKWDQIKTNISTKVESIKSDLNSKWTAIKSTVENVVNSLKSGVSNKWNEIKSSLSSITNTIKSTMSTAWTNIKTNIVNTANGLKSSLQTVWNNVKSNASQIFSVSNWTSLGRNIISGIVSGVKNAASSLYNALKDIAKKALQAAKDKLKIKSPSRLFADEVGEMIPAGVALGVNNNLDSVTDAMGNLSDVSEQGFNPSGVESLASSLQTALRGVNTGGINLNISVYGAPGQDEDVLAQRISERINAEVYRNRAVWGIA